MCDPQIRALVLRGILGLSTGCTDPRLGLVDRLHKCCRLLLLGVHVVKVVHWLLTKYVSNSPYAAQAEVVWSGRGIAKFCHDNAKSDSWLHVCWHQNQWRLHLSGRSPHTGE